MIIEKVIECLENEYGPLAWRPSREPIDVLIATILSQNTSDVNSRRAFDSLISTFDSWEAVACAPAEHIVQAIKSGGLSQVKALRIKLILNGIKRERGCINLDFLSAMSTPEDKDYLMHLPG